MEGRGDGKIGLISYRTACIVGILSDDYALDDDFVDILENGNYVYDPTHWVIEDDNMKLSKKQRNVVKAWKKQVDKHHRKKAKLIEDLGRGYGPHHA